MTEIIGLVNISKSVPQPLSTYQRASRNLGLVNISKSVPQPWTCQHIKERPATLSTYEGASRNPTYEGASRNPCQHIKERPATRDLAIIILSQTPRTDTLAADGRNLTILLSIAVESAALGQCTAAYALRQTILCIPGDSKAPSAG